MARALLLCGGLAVAASAYAFPLPPSCGPPSAKADNATPLPVLRKRLDALSETDPGAAVRLICDTIPRVEHTAGAHSPELAWWVASLATPLIAYMDKFDEAVPLLEFAEPILAQHLDRYAAEVADIHVAYAWIAFRQGRLADAGTAWEAALKVREQAPGPQQIELQKVLVGLAQVRLYQRDFPATHAALDRARAILVANHAAVSEAAGAIENIETNLAVREEDYARARAHAESQIRIKKQLQGGAPQLVPAYVLLGTIYARLEDFDASEAALREAIRLAESDHGPLQRHLLTALNQIAVLLNERDRPAEALPFAERALQLGESTLGADAPRLVGILGTLAGVNHSLGDLPQALRLYGRADAIIAKHRTDIERQVLVAHYRGLGDLQLELGDPQAAATALAAALEAAGGQPNLAIERGYTQLSLARTLALADPARWVHLEQARSLFQSRLPASHPIILRVINEQCAAEIAAQADNAGQCREAGDWLARKTDVEPSLRSAVYEKQSELAQRRGDSSGAYTEALAALAAAEAVGTPQPLYLAYFCMAGTLRRRDDPALAIFFGKQAVSQIERLRSDFVDDRQRERSFLTDKVAVYRALADWLMEAGRIDEGLDVLRLLKGQELYDFELRGANANATTPVGYTALEERLRERYAQRLRPAGATGTELDRLGQLRERDRLSPGERINLDRLLAGQASSDAYRVERIEEFIQSGAGGPSPAAGQSHAVQAEHLRRDLRRFGKDTTLAVYLLTATRLRILVATPGEQLEYNVPLEAATLQRQIGNFLAGIGQREDTAALSRSLYESVAAPVDRAARRAHSRRLVLWLDGALRYLPFAALSDGSGYLVDRYTIQAYAPAASSTTPVVETGARVLRVRGMGVTQAVAGFDALPGMVDELCAVVRGPISGLSRYGPACRDLTTGNGALPGEGFADGSFTEARLHTVLAEATQYPVLHMGTHFSLRPGNAMRSFMVLGDGGRLSLDSIGRLSFSGVDLVTLSACQTAMGGAVGDDGREIEGFSAIVQRSGARQVVASLWPVEDLSTAALMGTLYEALGSNGGDAPRALQQAQRSMRAVSVSGRHPYEHPYYWAGFVASVR